MVRVEAPAPVLDAVDGAIGCRLAAEMDAALKPVYDLTKFLVFLEVIVFVVIGSGAAYFWLKCATPMLSIGKAASSGA